MGSTEPQTGIGSQELFGPLLQIVYFIVAIFEYAKSHILRASYQVEALTLSPHKTPQLIRKDVAKLSKVPRHIAVILDKKQRHVEGGGVDGLLNDVGEIAAWCIGAGAAELTVYERSGVLQSLPLQDVYRTVEARLKTYFGESTASSVLLLSRQNDGTKSLGGPANNKTKTPRLIINLISETNGRKLIVDVTRVLSDMVAQQVTTPEDITLDVIDCQLKERIGTEPDLLVMFSPRIDLQGYPPWHIRVTEIYCAPFNDNNVSYYVFVKALRNFSTAKVNLGR